MNRQFEKINNDEHCNLHFFAFTIGKQILCSTNNGSGTVFSVSAILGFFLSVMSVDICSSRCFASFIRTCGLPRTDAIDVNEVRKATELMFWYDD